MMPPVPVDFIPGLTGGFLHYRCWDKEIIG
jgi:hypothetical protein